MRRLLLLLSFNVFMLLGSYGIIYETDRQALLDFKSQIYEDKRAVLSSWDSSFPLCHWKGVTCGRKHKRVTSLNLGGLQLGGVISPSIGNLSFLIRLNLSDNSFGGTIPQEIGNLFRLEYLYMSFNFLRGEIPASISNCSRLLNLQLFSNHLEEGVPSELGSLTKLDILYLSKNNLKGRIPESLGNLTSLTYLGFGNNNLEGGVPDSMARLAQVKVFDLSMNNFSSVVPPSIYNLSSLEVLAVFTNSFYGSLRPDFGNLLPNIRELYMGSNYFSGAIPTTLSNISTLQKLRLEYNNLTGNIPLSFRNLQNLQVLLLHRNSLGSYSSGDLAFVDSLTNCTQLQNLGVGHNRLGGELPTSIANLSTNLTHLSLETNFITGSIPGDIGNIINLQILGLQENLLTGPLPTSIGKLLELVILSVHSNDISGVIPSSIGNITRLQTLFLYNNKFEGLVPPSLGNCSYLLDLSIGSNKLSGTIPLEILQISPLINLNMSDNSLTGSLPRDIGRLEFLDTLSFADNILSGELPYTLGKCLSMVQLHLQRNSFDGVIPNLSGMVGVREVDLSSNNLSGTIPGYFANFSKLQYLNLSINNLKGRVPTQGKFQNATIVSVFGNKNLCGGIMELKLKPCFEKAPSVGTKHSSMLKIVVSVSISLILLLVIAFVYLCWFRKRTNNVQTNDTTLSTLGGFHEMVSYKDLQNATDGFALKNVIGSGSFGTVFKALLPEEKKIVAVKVLNLQRHGAMRSFLAECEALKDIRHRNLVKLLTACASIDSNGNEFRALIYEFLPNRSLDLWLHPEEVEEICRPARTLTLFERLNIAIDVASVLDYLHVHCHEPIAHCDLKPSNILLDEDLTAHVSDFGLARLLLKFDEETFLNQLSSAGVRGTIGYAAPEYGMGAQPSIHGDVYSFGVLVLEMFTGKRPTSELFGENVTLHSYTKLALPERVLEIVDKSLIDLTLDFGVADCLALVLDVGLKCCEETPTHRLAIGEAAKELTSLRKRLFRTQKTATP